MARSLLLWSFVLVFSLVLRAGIPPVYVGKPDEQLPTLPLAQPFGDDLKGSSDAFLSLQAKSILDNGLSATGGIPVFNIGRVDPKHFAWYEHHPPGVALTTALAFKIFGESELVARSVALLFSTITLIVVVALVARNLGGAAALITAVGTLASPMGWYWASHLDYQVPTIAACAVFLVCALRLPGRALDGVTAALALTLALSFDFLAVFAVVALLLERLIAGPRRWREFIGWPLLAGIVLFVLLGWRFLATRRYGVLTGGTLQSHILDVWSLPPGITWKAWLVQVGANVWEMAGPVPLLALIAALVGVIVRERAPTQLEKVFRASLFLALLAGLVPRARAYDHPYFQLYLQLPIALAFALTAGKWLTSDASASSPRSDGPARIVTVVASGVILAVGLFFTVWERPTYAEDVPSSHLLGREFAAKLSPEVRVVALEAASQFNQFAPDWYARKHVIRLPPGPEDQDAIGPQLRSLGLFGDKVWLARDARWPGRGGFQPLYPRPK